MPATSDADIARVLYETRSIALLGASPNPERPSQRVMQYLIAEGYAVYPVNPDMAGQTLLGRMVLTVGLRFAQPHKKKGSDLAVAAFSVWWS